MKTSELTELFEELYGKSNKNSIRTFFSPGRVNLIGEHTDYNEGYVFPCALDFGTKLVIRENNSDKLRFATTNFTEKGEISLKNALKKIDSFWYNYPLGVVDQLQKMGHSVKGCDFLYSGDIPNGAGLSSSASIETVTAFALNELFSLSISKLDIVKLSQKAENQFIGVNCGIMDQFAVTMGKKDHAIFLDCHTLEYDLVPLKMNGHKLIISNTNKRRGLADSKYNERRSECDTAVEMLNKKAKVEYLSQIDFEQFMAMKDAITNEVVFRRARHVISENKRAKDAVEALQNDDLKKFGELMNQSHDSLRDDYEVTGVELDTLVEEARKIKGVLGSRMTGAGFGGCTVSLIKEEAIEEFKEKVAVNYKQRIGISPDFYIAGIGDGAKEIL